MNRKLRSSVILIQAMALLTLLSVRLKADTGTCGGVSTTVPFTDVGSSIFFCQIAEAYFSGLTNGTSATTYSPSANVTRDQMAAFVARTQDSALRRGSKRAALNQWWTTTPAYSLSFPDPFGVTPLSIAPTFVQSDGADLWAAGTGGSFSRVRASDGFFLDNIMESLDTNNSPVVVAMGLVVVAGTTKGIRHLEVFIPFAGHLISFSLGPGRDPQGIAFDGRLFWIANGGGGSGSGSVTIFDLALQQITDVTAGFTSPHGILYDGTSVWVTDVGDDSLKRLNHDGTVAQTVAVGADPAFPIFDGTNIWVPNFVSSTVTVVRASTGSVLAILTGNGLNGPFQAAFDGERILVTNTLGNSVSLWKAADLTPIGTFSTGAGTLPVGVCSDGVNFWIALQGTNQLARF